MNKVKTTLLLAFFGLSVFAQENLVENPSFSQTADCNSIATLLEDLAEPWFHLRGTPDYYHQVCGFGGDQATTNNAQPFDGDEFVGIAVYGDTGSAYRREYVHGRLKTPLEAGRFYRVTFFVKPVNNDGQGVSYAANNIGMAFTENPIDSVPPNALIDYVKPQVRGRDVVTIESYWSPICGIFKAKGGERYITVGNFNDDISTSVVPLLGAATPTQAYYLIDFVQVLENDLPELPADTIICFEQRIDLQVSAPGVKVEWNDESTDKNFVITTPGTYFATISSASCSYVDSIVVEEANCDECKVYVPNAFTPNGDGNNDRFEVYHNCDGLQSFHLTIFDRWGQKVFETFELSQAPDSPRFWNGTADGDKYPQGIYTYTIEYEYPLFRRTQTLTKRGAFTLIR